MHASPTESRHRPPLGRPRTQPPATDGPPRNGRA